MLKNFPPPDDNQIATKRVYRITVMKNLLIGYIFVIGFTAAVFAQPRPMERAASQHKPAPEIFDAKYQGGFFGYSEKVDGKLKFDDINKRLVFFGEEGKELFGLAYSTIITIYPQSRSVTSTTGNIVRAIPLPGSIFGSFIKEKRRYLVLRFEDREMDIVGTMSFKLDNKELLDSVIGTLGEKTGLQNRGDAYYKPKETTTDDSD